MFDLTYDLPILVTVAVAFVGAVSVHAGLMPEHNILCCAFSRLRHRLAPGRCRLDAEQAAEKA